MGTRYGPKIKHEVLEKARIIENAKKKKVITESKTRSEAGSRTKKSS